MIIAQRTETTAEPTDEDPTTFIQSLPPGLRRQVSKFIIFYSMEYLPE